MQVLRISVECHAEHNMLRAALVRGAVLSQVGLCFGLVLLPCGFKQEAWPE